MEDGANNMLGTLSDNIKEFDLMDELFYDGCWLETTNTSSFLQQVPSSSASDFSSLYFNTIETNISHLNSDSHQKNFQEETEKSNSARNPPFVYPPMDELTASQRHSWDASASSSQLESFLVEVSEMDRRLWIGASGNPSPSTSVEKRLVQAFEQLKNTTRDRDVLIQIWVPIKREGGHVLTTNNQPFILDPNSKSLEYYRNISSRYQFATEEDSKEFFGLPGRVFLKKLPEWAPDVRLFKREDYPRISYAQQYNVRGSLALPVFERGSGTCLGVVEIVSTSLKVNYQSELDDVCKALEAVDLRSSDILTPLKSMDQDESYQAALAEIREILTVVCNTHKLPLAQTWAPCIQQGKAGCHRCDENSACVSIIDSACYVADKQVLGFHEACSKHHLLRGEGVAGGAFMTNQPCFTTDISAFSETEYPLAYHARMFRLHGAVAVRLRSIYTGLADFILEFFLPLDCKDSEEQKQMLSSLSSVIQQVSRCLRVVTDQELVEETQFPVREEAVAPSVGGLTEEEETRLASSPSEEATRDESSWIANMMEAQQKDKGLSVYLGHHKEEPEEEFKVNTHWNNTSRDLNPGPGLSEHKEILQDGPNTMGGGEWSSVKGKRFSSAKKAGEQRRTKTERTISLQVLRQYFAGSLKDAATSIGVCPTTLKRICRQHGITRWPSRKIRKVGHSLKKLQLVIDSVQGGEGAIQLSSFYTNFPELSSPNIPGTSSLGTSKMDDHLKQLHTQPDSSLLSPATTASKSASSSCSHSSSSSFCCSTGAKETHVTASAPGGGHASMAGGVLKRASSDAKLHDLGQEETKFLVRSQSHKIFTELPSLEALPPLPKGNHRAVRSGSSFRVKATFGEEKIRFSMPQEWGFGDLQGEILRRFNIEDLSKMDLKYLDDDSEWILLTCNDDLEECIDIHRSSGSSTIKLSLRQGPSPNLGSWLDSCAPS